MEENIPPSTNVPPPPPTAPPPPPPSTPPPVIRPAAASPQPRRGRGWMILALVLLFLLALSMLYNFAGFTSRVLSGGGSSHYARTAGPRIDEVLREDNGAANKIAVIEVNGVITGEKIDQGFSQVDVIKAQLKRAEEDDHVKACILRVDSPGGEVLASDEMYRAISEFQNKAHKPVIASMGSLAASGGYYISSPCRWIVANELTITGSIGVIMSSWNYRGLMDKVGLVPQTYKSGRFKDMLSGSKRPEDITDEEKAMVQGLIDETFSKFKSVVQEGRAQAYQKNKNRKGRQLSDDWQDYADGRVLSGTEAYKLGFVDELGGFDDAVDRAKALVGISEANLVEYQQRYDLSDFFRLFGKSESKAVKIELAADMPKVQAGKLYFLAPTYLH